MDIHKFYSEQEDYLHEFAPNLKEGHLYSVFMKENEKHLKGKNVLQIGCNTGSTTVLLKKKIGDGKLCAIDINSAAIEEAKHNLKGAKIEVEVKAASAHSTGYPDNYFDTIILWDVYEHWIPNHLSIFNKELARILKPKGIMLVYVPRAEEGNQMAFDKHHRGYYKDTSEFLETFVPYFSGICRKEDRVNPARPEEKHCGLFAIIHPLKDQN